MQVQKDFDEEKAKTVKRRSRKAREYAAHFSEGVRFRKKTRRTKERKVEEEEGRGENRREERRTFLILQNPLINLHSLRLIPRR